MDGEIHVINLARRPERWQHWEAQAKRWGVTGYKRFNAIDGKKSKTDRRPKTFI